MSTVVKKNVTTTLAITIQNDTSYNPLQLVSYTERYIAKKTLLNLTCFYCLPITKPYKGLS